MLSSSPYYLSHLSHSHPNKSIITIHCSVHHKQPVPEHHHQYLVHQQSPVHQKHHVHQVCAGPKMKNKLGLRWAKLKIARVGFAS